MNRAMGAAPTLQFREVLTLERQHLKLDAPIDQLSGIGLALSGGGIRSASFALGVAQALLNRGWFSRFDYLSTVSGGGYLGAALSWLQNRYGADFRRQLGSATSGARSDEVEAAPPGRTWLDYIRQHGNYLEPDGLRGLSLFGVVARGLLISVFVYGGAIAILFGVLGQLHALPPPALPRLVLHPAFPIEYLVDGLAVLLSLQIGLFALSTWLGAIRPWETVLGDLVVTAAVGWAALRLGARDPVAWSSPAVVLIVPLLFTLVTCLWLLWAGVRAMVDNAHGSVSAAWQYRVRISLQRLVARLVAVLIGTTVVWSLPWVYFGLGKFPAAWASGTLTAGGILAAFKTLNEGKSSMLNILPKGLVIPLAAVITVYALLVIGYSVQLAWPMSGTELLGAALVVLAVGLLVDVNYVGPARMYRDRLMEAFMPDTSAVAAGQWQPANEADSVTIREFADTRPYHLVNCNAVLVDAVSDTFRGRGGDSFCIAPLYSGSTATGWIPSETLGGRRSVPLATAMATSGAAVNPDAGGPGGAATRVRVVAFLMWLFSIRLAYWIRNPGTGWLGRVLAFGPPNFWFPGVMQGLLGKRLHEKSAFLELSDGGHFDNTAIYELIRRRTRIIVASEAGADPGATLADLATVIERVRVDFGVHIRFDDPELDTRALRPTRPLGRYVKRGFAIATIHYPSIAASARAGEIAHDPVMLGILLYLQAVPVESIETRPDVESYHLRHPTFPNEATTNQFFTEEQLEAYRELGLMIAGDAIDLVESTRPVPDAMLDTLQRAFGTAQTVASA